MIVVDELGRIHDSPSHSDREREEDELLEALALSLSLTPLESGPVRRKAPPPAPPVTVVHPPLEPRPLPPDESPPVRLRPVNRLPVLFPPVGHVWNRSPLASPKQRAAPKRVRRHPRIWAPRSEGFAYFPPNGSGYPGPLGRRRVTVVEHFETDSDAGESRDDASSGVSTAESHYNAERYPGHEDDFGR